MNRERMQTLRIQALEAPPEPLYGVVETLLSPRDRELLRAVYDAKSTDAEIAEKFGPDALDRLFELGAAIGRLFRFIDGIAAWKGATAKEAPRC